MKGKIFIISIICVFIFGMFTYRLKNKNNSLSQSSEIRESSSSEESTGQEIIPQAKANVLAELISKEEFDIYEGEKFSDNSKYVTYFTITFDAPVTSFSINYVNDNGTEITTGDEIYGIEKVKENTPLYFAVSIYESDLLYTRGFSYINADESEVQYALHISGKDGSLLKIEY